MMQEGDRVMHSTSGRGVILECSGMRARVQYDDGAVSWVELKDLKTAPCIEVHNGVDLDAAYALLLQQLGATPACSRHPHESRWVLVEEEIDEMHSDSSNPQHEAGVVYYVYDLGSFEGKLTPSLAGTAGTTGTDVFAGTFEERCGVVRSKHTV